MDFDSLEKEIKKGQKISIVLFNMKYIIEKEEDKYVIYPSYDVEHKTYYDSIKKMFDEYKVYSESLEKNINKMKIMIEIEEII